MITSDFTIKNKQLLNQGNFPPLASNKSLLGLQFYLLLVYNIWFNAVYF